MTDQQFQILLLVFSFVGTLIIILLSVIAHFIRASLGNIKSRLDSHSSKLDDQATWNEHKAGLLMQHSTQLSVHERELFTAKKR